MFSYWAKPEDTLDLSEILNDHIARCVNQYPQRLIGLGTVPLQDPDLAITELTRCVTQLGLRGVQIGTHINDWPLSEPKLYKFFQKAEELNASLFIHPWDMFGSELMKKYFLPWLVGMPAETSLAICSLMFSGVFEKLPNLRICFAHGGGAFPSTIGRIQHGWAVRPDLCAKDTTLSPLDHLGKFWADSLVHDADGLDMIVKVFGEDKVCLGTDYPFPLGEYTAESFGTVYAAGELIDSMGIYDNDDDNQEKNGQVCCGGCCCCTNTNNSNSRNDGNNLDTVTKPEGTEDGAKEKGTEQNNVLSCHCSTNHHTSSTIPPRLPTSTEVSSPSSSSCTQSSSSSFTYPVPPKGIPYNPLAIPNWDYFTYTPHSYYQQYIGTTMRNNCGPIISSHQQKLIYTTNHSFVPSSSSSYLRPRFGWTHDRRKKIYGSNALDWLNLPYEQFIRK